MKSISPNSSEIGSSFYNQFNQEVNQDYSINSGNDLNKDNLNSSIENYATEKLFENIELQNKEIKNFFNLNNLINEEESDGVNDSVQSLNEYLKLNGFLILLDKLEQGSLTRLEIINLDEKSLEELVEEENKHKIPRLVKFFLRVENEEDADDLFKSIEKHLNS